MQNSESWIINRTCILSQYVFINIYKSYYKNTVHFLKIYYKYQFYSKHRYKSKIFVKAIIQQHIARFSTT